MYLYTPSGAESGFRNKATLIPSLYRLPTRMGMVDRRDPIVTEKDSCEYVFTNLP